MTRCVISSRPYRVPAARRARIRSLATCALLACLLCPPAAIVGDEPRLGDSLKNLLASTGLAGQQGTATGAQEDVPPLPVTEPAPLELDAEAGLLGGLGPQEVSTAVDEIGPVPGDVEVVHERYPNRQVKIEREVTQDAQGNYVNHGVWKMWDERGNLVAEGQYNMGRRTGRWTRWHGKGDSGLFGVLPFTQARPPYISQASFEADVLHGDWTIYDARQQPLSRITFRNGERNGPATLWLPTGQVIRQMNYAHGELEGDVMEMGQDGKLARTATYQQGRRIAEKTTMFKGSRNRQTQAVYLFAKLVPKTPDDFWTAKFAEYEPVGKDERHGAWVTWYPNGQMHVQGQYQNDLPVGKFTWWHPNGQKYAEGEYVDGRQNGAWQWWHKNGQKWTEGEYNHGEQAGQWSSWTEEGRLDQQASYSGADRPAIIAESSEETAEISQSSRKTQ